jgi:uncharacterized lipoprotein YajG
MRKICFVLQGLLLLAGCAMPQTVVRTVDNRPSIAVQGAPRGTVLFVDGQGVGEAAAFDGDPTVLRVEPGTHEVDVRDAAGNVLFRQKVFVESELKTIQVH